MRTIEILNELIKDTAKVEIVENYSRYCCTLDEEECEYDLKINNLPQDSVVIKGDKFPSPKEIFKGTKSECKRADYIVVSATNDKKVIIYIELKNSKKSSSAKKITAQLRGAKCLMKYCKTIAEEFWNESDFMSGYEHRFVRFEAKSLDKRGTRSRKNDKNDTPEKALILKNRSVVQFKQLIG